jgi:hypothetical protein
MQLEGEPIRMRLKVDLGQQHSTTMTAAPITSAGRFSPRGPRGMALTLS